MGIATISFNCGHCGHGHTGQLTPNWTNVDTPTVPGTSVIVLSCVKCQAALGVYSVQAPRVSAQ